MSTSKLGKINANAGGLWQDGESGLGNGQKFIVCEAENKADGGKMKLEN